MIDYIAVIDFEATCFEKSPEHEIIEFPTVIIDVKTRQQIDSIQLFVKPVKTPILSDFCKNLTGITQEQVDSGLSLLDAIDTHKKFMSKYPNSRIVTCGNWDFSIMFPMDCKAKNIQVDKMYTKWINLKNVFDQLYKDKIYKQKSHGMMGMLKFLGIEHIGRHHSGLDDCINIANIVSHTLELNYIYT